MMPRPSWPRSLALGCLLPLLLLVVPLGSAAEAGEWTYGPVRPGETLWQIAGRAYPNAGFDRDRVMLALLEANPQALSPPCNVNGTLRVGARLRLPAPQVVADLDADRVREQIAEQRRLWAEHRHTGRPLECPPAAVPEGATPAAGETLGVGTAADAAQAAPLLPQEDQPPVPVPAPVVAEVPAVSAPAGEVLTPEPGPAAPSEPGPAVAPPPTGGLGQGGRDSGPLLGAQETPAPLAPGPSAPLWVLGAVLLGLVALATLRAQDRRGAAGEAAAGTAPGGTGLRLGLRDLPLLLPLAALGGLLGAGATVLFREGIHALEWLVGSRSESLVLLAEGLPQWQRLLLPAAGGLVAGLILQQIGERLRGRTTTDYMESVAQGDGWISVRHSLVKGTSSLVTVASGGSIGREGAMVQLAAMTASALGRIARLPADQLRLLVAAGAAAGLASAYNAPLAATLFVAEIVLGSIALEHIGPLVIAAVIANVTVHGVLGYAPAFAIPPLGLVSDWELGLYLLLGLAAGHVAPLFLRLLEHATKLFGRLSLGLGWRMALGGLLVGALSLYEPQVWGNGYSVVNAVLHEPWAWQALLTVLLLKMVATAATYGSGAVGGVFTPTLFVGALLGALFGTLAHGVLPVGTAGPNAYAVVGMGAMLAATTHAPLMSILMIYEMTQDYQIVLPLMLAVVTAHYTARRHGGVRPMYAESLLPRAGETAAPQRGPAPSPSFEPQGVTPLADRDAGAGASRRWHRLRLLLPLPHTSLHPLARLRSWHRLALAVLAGAAASTLAAAALPEARYLAGWLAAAVTYLAIVWWGIDRLDPDQTRLRASSLDPGGLAIYSLIVATSWVSLMGVLLVTDTVGAAAGLSRWGHMALALAALAATWLLIQTVFALRYARRYYEDDSPGLVFPGGDRPSYRDFAYFSAVIGMTSQVADVGIAEPTMRRLVLVHGLLSFGFNLLVLALMVNLLASALG